MTNEQNEIKLFINGEFREGSEGKTYDSLNPCNGETIARVHLPSTKDIDDAVDAASAAGQDCDGQVLVIYDVIGLSQRIPKMAKNFLTGHGSIQAAVNSFISAVKSGSFPKTENIFNS